MPSYTNPATIVVGANEDANQLRSNFDALQAALNGNLDEVNVPNLTAAFTAYKPGPIANGTVTAGGPAFPYYMSANGAMAQSTQIVTVGPQAFNLDPAAFAANARTTKLRVRMTILANGAAPAITATAGLYSISSVAGAANQLTVTLGAVVAGSTIASGTINASTVVNVAGADFNAPASGAYVLGVALSGTQAVNSLLAFSLSLEMRQV